MSFYTSIPFKEDTFNSYLQPSSPIQSFRTKWCVWTNSKTTDPIPSIEPEFGKSPSLYINNHVNDRGSNLDSDIWMRDLEESNYLFLHVPNTNADKYKKLNIFLQSKLGWTTCPDPLYTDQGSIIYRVSFTQIARLNKNDAFSMSLEDLYSFLYLFWPPGQKHQDQIELEKKWIRNSFYGIQLNTYSICIYLFKNIVENAKRLFQPSLLQNDGISFHHTRQYLRITNERMKRYFWENPSSPDKVLTELFQHRLDSLNECISHIVTNWKNHWKTDNLHAFKLLQYSNIQNQIRKHFPNDDSTHVNHLLTDFPNKDKIKENRYCIVCVPSNQQCNEHLLQWLAEVSEFFSCSFAKTYYIFYQTTLRNARFLGHVKEEIEYMFKTFWPNQVEKIRTMLDYMDETDQVRVFLDYNMDEKENMFIIQMDPNALVTSNVRNAQVFIQCKSKEVQNKIQSVLDEKQIICTQTNIYQNTKLETNLKQFCRIDDEREYLLNVLSVPLYSAINAGKDFVHTIFYLMEKCSEKYRIIPEFFTQYSGSVIKERSPDFGWKNNKSPLRPYQEKAISCFFHNKCVPYGSMQSGGITFPCGAGKSLTGIGIVEKCKRRTLILSTSELSLKQWRQGFLENTNIDPSRIHIIGANDNKEPLSKINETDFYIVLCTFNMLTSSNNQSNSSNRDRIDLFDTIWPLIIVDEVHRSVAKMSNQILTHLPSMCRVGLTATMFRSDNTTEDIYRQIGSLVYTVPWLQLQREGYIARLICMSIECPMDPLFKAQYNFNGNSSQTVIKACLAGLNPNKLQLAEYLIRYHLEQRKPSRIIVVTRTLRMLDILQSIWKYPVVRGKTSNKSSEREIIIKRFNSGDKKYAVLLASSVIDEALDMPSANVLIEMSIDQCTERTATQRLGRISRKKPSWMQNIAFHYTLISQDTNERGNAEQRKGWLERNGIPYHDIEFSKFKNHLVTRHDPNQLLSMILFQSRQKELSDTNNMDYTNTHNNIPIKNGKKKSETTCNRWAETLHVNPDVFQSTQCKPMILSTNRVNTEKGRKINHDNDMDAMEED